jgi:hypothetical protein
MTLDTRQILLTATTYTGQVETANIVGNAPATSEIASGIPGALPVITQLNDVALNFTATNMGEENIPDPRLFKFLSDEFKLNEQAVKQVFKNLSDLSTTDEQVRKLLQKVLQDITTTSDVFDRVWTAYRTYTDSTTNTELLQKDFQKVLLDLSNSSDLLRTDVGKYLADVTALANLSYAVILVGKDLQDQTIGFTDVLTRIVDFNRTFEDTAFMTDDFYGAANIDDDEYADVYKVVLEWIRPEETFSVDIDKPDVEDQAALGEQAYLEPQIPKTDQVVNADLQFATIALSKLDQTTNSELQVFDITKPDREDTATTSEQQAFDVVKPDLVDQATNSDLQTLDVGQTSSDSFTAQTEEYYFDVDKPDIADQATATDQAAKDFSKPADDDQVSIAELLLTKLIGLNINEIDYFLEDYVFDITDYTFKAVHARDQITQIVVTKQFEDLVDSTDDFYGEANIDDDEYASIDKVLADYSTFSENFDRVVQYIRLFYETATMLEQAELAATKVVSDQTSNSELTNSDVYKVNNDQTTTSETKSFDVEQTSIDQATSSEQATIATSTVYSDQATTTDDFSRFYQAVRVFAELTQTTERIEQLVERVSSDQAVFTELFTRAVEKFSNDQAATSEQQTFDFYGVYEELVDATDDFYGAANIDDDQIATVDKVLADYATNSETITTVAEFYRTFLETAISADQATFDFAKSLLDTVTTSERFQVDFSTSRTETATISETVQQAFETSRTETVAQIDLFTQSIEPAKYETVVTSEATAYDTSLDKRETANTAETVAQDFSTPRTDVASILELFTSEWTALRSYSDGIAQTDTVSLDTTKPATETTTTSDAQTLDVIKRPLDTTTTSEVVGKDATTEFSELVDATDDFYGAATVGDDEYAAIDKVLADYATNSDVVTTLTTFLRSVNESQILSEVFAAATDKALSDITNSSDTVTLLTAPTKLESVSTSQTISLTLQSYFSQDYAQLGYTGETYTY